MKILNRYQKSVESSSKLIQIMLVNSKQQSRLPMEVFKQINVYIKDEEGDSDEIEQDFELELPEDNPAFASFDFGEIGKGEAAIEVKCFASETGFYFCEKIPISLKNVSASKSAKGEGDAFTSIFF